jgi:hypothetical protein
MRTHARLHGFKHTDDGYLVLVVSEEAAWGGPSAEEQQVMDAMLIGDPGLTAPGAPGVAQRPPLMGPGARKVGGCDSCRGLIVPC